MITISGLFVGLTLGMAFLYVDIKLHLIRIENRIKDEDLRR